MRIDLIKGLVIHELRPLEFGDSDRRGPICDLMLAEIPNAEHAIGVAVRILQRVCSLLDDSYFWSDNRDKGPSQFTEQFEAWIDPTPSLLEGKAVRIRHKYWTQKRVEGFLEIMLQLAQLHGWEVEDRRTKSSIAKAGCSTDMDGKEFLRATTAIHAGAEYNQDDLADMAELAVDITESAYQMNTCPWRLLALNAAGMCWCSPGKEKP
jgi:hypothetical protein